VSADNCDDCKDFERELEHAKTQIQTFERLVDSQKEQIEHLKERVDRDSENAMKILVQMQHSTLELNSRLLQLVEKLALLPKT
jgi:predicted RNase H-like nuclease (RuvC/YqgF family)